MNIIVDCESTGPIPNLYSLIEIGAVAILKDKSFSTFHINIAPINNNFDPGALEAIGLTMEDINSKERNNAEPKQAMEEFRKWILDLTCQNKYRPTFFSDNNGYDFAWINYYFHYYLGSNPFGFSSRRIGDIWAGLVKDVHKPWKQLRDSPHDHNSLHDAIGNAEVLIKFQEQYGLRINF